MSVKKQLLALQKKRADLIEAMERVLTSAEEQERDFSEDEQSQYDSAKTEIQSLDKRIKQAEEVERLVAENSRPIVPGADDEEKKKSLSPIIKVSRYGPKKVPGGVFARMALYMVEARGVPEVASILADRDGEKDLAEAMRNLQPYEKAAAAAATSTTAGWAAELIQQDVQGFIDLLRPMSIFSRIPAGFEGSFAETNSIKIPKMTTGLPGGYVAEGGAIPVKAGAFTSLTLTPSKMGVITVGTREMFSRSNPNAELILRDAMLRDTAIVQDRKFLSNVAAGSGAPSGLFHTDNAPAAITASNLSNAADDANADLVAIEAAMNAASVPLGQRVWLMHSTKRLALASLRNAVGTFIYRDELATGNLNGYPVIESPVFDFGVNNGSSTNIKTIAMVNTGLLAKAFGLAPTIRVSEDATLHMDTAPSADLGGAGDPTVVRSLFQTDSMALRLLWENTWRTQHTVAVQYISDVNW